MKGRTKRILDRAKSFLRKKSQTEDDAEVQQFLQTLKYDIERQPKSLAVGELSRQDIVRIFELKQDNQREATWALNANELFQIPDSLRR